MPWAYQFANPNGRPYHDDWGIMSKNKILQFFQPYQKIKRMDCAYKLPLPFKIINGPITKEWRLWDTTYPTVPGTPIEFKDYYTIAGKFSLPHALTDEAGYGLTTYAAYIDGEWVECFSQYHKKIGSKRLSYYRGLKQDLTVGFHEDWSLKSDLMCWFPELSVTFIKET